MKTIKLFPVLVITAILFLMSSCTQDDSFEETELDAVKTTSANFNILPLTDDQVRSTRYTANYQVEITSSDFDITNDKMQLEIPLPVNDFSFLRAYNVSTDNNVAILYVIQREKQNVVVNLPIKFVAQDEINLSELNIDTELLTQNGCLRVYVMNNSEKDMNADEDLIISCLKDTLDSYTCEDKYTTPSDCDFTDGGENKRPGTLGGGIIQSK